MSFQGIIVIVLVLGAMAYLGYRIYTQLHKKECSKGCGCAEITVSKK